MQLKLIRQVATPCDAQTGLSESQEVRPANLDKTSFEEIALDTFRRLTQSNLKKTSFEYMVLDTF